MVALGVAMIWVARRSGRAIALPAMVALAFAGFYLWLLLSGVSLAEAGQRGLLLGPFEVDRGFLGAFRPGLLAEADYRAILPEIPALATLVGLAFVGAMLNASGIELGTGQPVDLNRDLRGVGIANLLAGLGGGVAGYHILGGTLLANRLTGANSRWIGVGVGLISAVALVAGASVLSVLPVGVFAAVLAFLGIDLLYQWLWVERQRLALPDFLLVLAILAIVVTVGFLQAIAVGVLAASALFVFAYSRLDVIRARLTGAARLSTTERPEPAVRRLVARGRETLVFELQGYVFFGTAHALLERARPPRRRARTPPSATPSSTSAGSQGLDASAVFNLGKLEQICSQHGVRLLFAGLGPRSAARSSAPACRPCRRSSRRSTRRWPASRRRCSPTTPTPRTPPPDAGFAALLDRAAAGRPPLSEPEAVRAGTEVLRQGEASDSPGPARAAAGSPPASKAPTATGRMRVATFLPGAVVGEIGLYAGTPRTATVAADVDSRILRVTREQPRAPRRSATPRWRGSSTPWSRASSPGA